MAQTDEAPAPREKKFLVTAVVGVDESSWRQAYGDALITPETVAQWLTFQFIGSAQQGVDVLSATEVPADAPNFSKIAVASNNG